MNHYLVDHTREYLAGTAAYIAALDLGDSKVEIIAKPETVQVRGCLGGLFRAWFDKELPWEEVATAKTNPLPALVETVLFLMARHAQALRPHQAERLRSGAQPNG